MISLLHEKGSGPLFYHQGQAVSAGQFAAAATALAERLPKQHTVLNLCQNRLNFAVGLCAAAAVGSRSLLPPSRATETLTEIAASNAPCVVLRDDEMVELTLPMIDVTPDWSASKQLVSLPAVNDDFVALTVYTSGSTGTPAAHHKRWSDLVCENSLLSERLLYSRDGLAPNIVATVPPQHMFGLATSVFTALYGGNTVHSGRPIYPADVSTSLSELSAPRVLVTTPAHLRVLVKSAAKYPPVEMILSATAPLSPELAALAAERFSAEVHEIYGCTEAGSIATRNSVNTASWTPYPRVMVVADGDQFVVSGPQLPQPQQLADQLAIDDDGSFRLLGRCSDMVNIAGKRASLSDLNLKLHALEGVCDGVFWMSSEAPRDGKQPRLQAAIVSALDDRTIQNSLALHLDPAFIPRSFKRVDKLPRNENGKLISSQVEALFKCP